MKTCIVVLSVALLSTGTLAGWEDLSANIPDPDADLADVHFIGSAGWICSSSRADVYHTTDGGMTFTTQQVGAGCRSLFMLDTLQGYACGASGLVYRTTNGGAEWNYHGSVGQTVTSIHFPPGSDTGYCCGLGGEICLVTPDGVARMTSGTSEDLRSIWFPVTAAEGWVCGTSTILHFSGGEWRADQAFPPGDYNSLCMFNNRIGWAVGDHGLMTRTSFADSWREMYNPDSLDRDLHDVFFHTDANYGWIVGDRGLIMLTIDGGRWWRIRAPGLSNRALRAVFATGQDEVYAVGDSGTFLKYTSAPGFEESSHSQDTEKPWMTSVLRGALLLPPRGWSVLLDLAGREVMSLQPGENDIRHIAPGIYFVRTAESGGRSAVSVCKVVVQR